MNTPNTHLNYAKSINFGVRDYLEGKFEGWMKRKGYDIQDDKFHDWFMNGYWGSEIKPKEDKYLEVYNYGARLAKGNSSHSFASKSESSKVFVSQLKIGDVINTHKKYCKVTGKKKGNFVTSKIIICEPLDGSDPFEIEKATSDKITIYGDVTEFSSGRKNLSVARAINDRLEDLKKFYMNVDIDKATKMGSGADSHLKNIKFEIDALNKCKSILVNSNLWLDDK